jgi:tetratricopeptide (TPR) repeat protein
VVYDSILTKKRKKLHEQIGIAMEKLFEENISEYYTPLAEHFFEAEEYINAAQYSKLVGKRAGQTGSINEAIVYAKKTICSLERLPMTEDLKKQIIDARTIMGLRMIEMNYFPEAREAIEPIVKIAFKSNYENRISQILTIIGGCEYTIEENLPEAFEHLEKALEISEKLGDIETQSTVNFWLGYGLSLNNEFERALHHLEKVLRVQEKANNLVWISTVKSLSGYLAYYYWGKIDEAYRVGLDSIPIAEKSDDIYSKVFAYGAHGVHCFGKGYFKEAINYLLKGLEASRKIRHNYWDSSSNQFLGEAYFEVKEYHKSKEHYENAVLIMDQNRVLPSINKLNKIGVARAKVMANEKDIDLTALFGYVRENKLKRCQGWMMRHVAEILLNIDSDHVPEAEDCIKTAIKADIRNEMKFHLGRDYALYAELLKRKGNKPKAKENLAKAIDILKECSADGWVTKYEEEMALLS